jgi:hypothetical protein
LCAFNRSREPKADISLRLRGLDSDFDFRKPVAPPPLVVAEKVFQLPGELAPNEGRWVSVAVPNEAVRGTPKTFEAFVTSAGH